MASLAQAWLAAGLGRNDRARLHLTLCNDQFSRWGVQAAARDAFLFLKSSVAFDDGQLPGYEPQRNVSGRPFPVEKPVTFLFVLRPPNHEPDLERTGRACWGMR